MPTVTETPEGLKPYVFHGLDLDINGPEAVGQCPFCGRDGKFSVNVETGHWRCFVCGGGQEKGGGGVSAFLDALWKISFKETATADYATLAKDRGIEYPDTLIQWNLAKSLITGEWLMPGYDTAEDGKRYLRQLYLYRSAGGRRAWIPTASSGGHALLGLHLLEESKQEIYVCEGPWDGMRLWEVLRTTKVSGDTFAVTGSVEHSISNGANVVAVATCTSFNTKWLRWFNDKSVVLWYDNDHPQKHPRTGVEMPSAGHAGMQRDAHRIAEVANSVLYLRWGKDGYDPELPHGYDVRDALKNRIKGLELLHNRTEPIPEEWVKSGTSVDSQVRCRPCSDWKTLVNGWRKALKWTPGLEKGLAVMLAVSASTKMLGDQLWVKIIGPPSCGKSTLAEALTVNRRHIIAKSTIRGFHSGFKSTTGQDTSLIDSLRDKTLITKDGDTLLQSPNLGQILSEARDLYDCVSRTHYRNEQSKDYEGVRTTWLLCGTGALRSIDASELGQRFLDCVVMDKAELLENEDDILWRKAHQAASHVDLEANCDINSQYSPEMINCMELTGGYIDWLRANAAKLLPKIEFSDEAKLKCIHLGKFVAYTRARPSIRQQEQSERELAARLVSVHIRLAKCLALVYNQSSVNEEVLNKVRAITLDTGRGIVLEVATALYKQGAEGLETKSLALRLNYGEGEMRGLLRYLREIEVVDLRHVQQRTVWVLTRRFHALYVEVMQ